MGRTIYCTALAIAASACAIRPFNHVCARLLGRVLYTSGIGFLSVSVSSEHSLIPLIFLQILHWCPYCAASSTWVELAIECARSYLPCGVTGNQLSLILRKGTKCRQNPSGQGRHAQRHARDWNLTCVGAMGNLSSSYIGCFTVLLYRDFVIHRRYLGVVHQYG